jgi:hypothetical protein
VNAAAIASCAPDGGEGVAQVVDHLKQIEQLLVRLALAQEIARGRCPDRRSRNKTVITV